MSEDTPEPVGSTAAIPRPASAPWRAVALALAGALAVVAGLVATAPLWAPLLPWTAAAPGETRQLADRIDRLSAAGNETRQQMEQTATATNAAVQRLDRRVAALDARPEPAAASEIAELRRQLAAAASSAQQLGSRIDALDKAMRTPAAPDVRDLALAVAINAIRDATAAGRPFAAQYDALLALAHDRPEVIEAAKPLAAAATGGVPSRAALAADGLRRLSGDGSAAKASPPADSGWSEAMLARLTALVKIRRIDGPAAPGGAAVAVATRRALAVGDLAGAVAALDKLSPPPPAVAAWLLPARRRLAVDAAILRIETLAAAHLAAAIPAAPTTPGSGAQR